MEIIRISKNQGHLVFNLFNEYRVFYKQPSDIEAASNFIHQRLDNDESVIFVALDTSTGLPVGFTQLYPIYSSVRMVKNWLLNDLFVHQHHRKQGIGEALIQTAMHFAKQNNARFVELSTATDNHTAQRLYEQIGFKKLAPETDFMSYRISLNG